jgi:hypothetical protein
MNRTIRTILPAAMLLCAASAFAATLTGTVTDRTTDKPSAGDTIAVINTAVSMDEIAKATSDAKGNFHVEVPDGGQILLHITHGGADYFKSVPPGGATAEIDVYDSAAKIDGISGEALVLRAETDPAGKILTVAENFFVQNASAPPRTQFGGNTFEFYLPKGAQILETVASAPGGLPTNSKVKTVDAVAGHYAFTFPVRPGGDTRFQVEYTLPYNGRQAFSLKLSVPTGDVAVMLPKTMQFEGAAAFQAITDPQVKAQTYDDHQPTLDQPLEFAIAGAGQLPEDNTQGAAGGDQTGQPTASGQRPGGGLGVPVDPGDENAPLSKYKWWIVGGLGLALAAGAGIMLKNSPATAAVGGAPTLPEHEPDFVNLDAAPRQTPAAFLPAAPSPVQAGSASSLLQGLKDELFELETDRITGRITQEQYAEQKGAFDVVLKRALSRIES